MSQNPNNNESSIFVKSLVVSTALCLTLGTMLPASALVVRDDVTVEGSEEQGADPKWDGVVQILSIDLRTGFGGYCTGSMINQRTVITAAHCLNSFAGTDYSPDGPVITLIMHGPDTEAALDAFQNNSFLGYLDDRTGIHLAQQAIIHPDAELEAVSFPGADVAMLSVSNPLSNLPTYDLLFSPVTVGTHVSMVAYGSHGIGTTSNVDIDGKRQAGENLIGFIGGYSNFFNAIEGAPIDFAFGPEWTQGLYWIDFDNPNRTGEECARRSPEDDVSGFGSFGGVQCEDWTNGTLIDNTLFLGSQSLDMFGDDAIQNEAGTAGGDSGSAIFVDQLSENPLISGVLSGGWSFVTNPGSAYGDVSYYNPLFNFQQFISEANPYKYVSASAGDGTWSDSARWIQTLDPGYMIVDENGQIVNGIPVGPETGVAGNTVVEGSVYGYDGTGQPVAAMEGQVPANADAAASSRSGGGNIAGLATNFRGDVKFDGSASGGLDLSFDSGVFEDSVEADPELETLLFTGPHAIDYGAATGAGSTGFVPNNGMNNAGWFNYFNVNLTANGTTSVDMDVIIDNLTISGSGAALNIQDGFNFTSIVDVRNMAGALNVDGNLITRDLMNLAMLTGGGSISAETVWNGGIISASTGGTLNITGDLVLTSAGVLVHDGGLISVDGGVALNGGLAATNLAYGESGTVLEYTGSRTGEFTNLNTSSVLFFEVSYDDENRNISYTVDAQDFQNFVSTSKVTSSALASMVSANRISSASQNADLYAYLDQLPTGSIDGAFRQMAPNGVMSMGDAGLASAEVMKSQLNTRMRGGSSGAVAATSDPKNFSAMMLNGIDNGLGGSAYSMPMSSALHMNDAPETGESNGTYADSKWSFFGRATNLSGTHTQATQNVETDIDGQAIILGDDRAFNSNLRAGAFFNFSQTEGVLTKDLTGNFTIDGYAIGGFGSYNFGQQAQLNSYVGVGMKEFESSRVGLSGASIGDGNIDETMAGANLVLLRTFMGERNFAFEPSLGVDF